MIGRLGDWAGPVAVSGPNREYQLEGVSCRRTSPRLVLHPFANAPYLRNPSPLRITGGYVRLERHDPAANRHRHYSLYFEPTLWHPRGALVLRWGRVSGFGNRTGYTRTGAPRGLDAAPARAAATRW